MTNREVTSRHWRGYCSIDPFCRNSLQRKRWREASSLPPSFSRTTRLSGKGVRRKKLIVAVGSVAALALIPRSPTATAAEKNKALGPRAHKITLCHQSPANCPGRIDQELGRTRNVCAGYWLSGVNQLIAPITSAARRAFPCSGCWTTGSGPAAGSTVRAPRGRRRRAWSRRAR